MVVGSSVSVQGAVASVAIGGQSNTIGTVNVGAGASLSFTATIGVAHDENGHTQGLGTLVVNGSVRLIFVDDTKPLDCLNPGFFGVGTFFRRVDGHGAVIDLDEGQRDRFAHTHFEARSDRFVISQFAFGPPRRPTLGASRMPWPASLPLLLLGLGAMGQRHARHSAAPAPVA